jgi:hypothetical protein
MRTAPVVRVAAAGLIRRWRPAIVIGLVLAISAAASVLAAALTVDMRGPFNNVFAAQHGAHVTATADLSRATMGQLAVGRSGTPVTVWLGGPSGAVAAGSTRIRILKIIGFSPGQVAAAYAGQGLVPAATGCIGGVLLANLLARPLLAGAAYSFGPGVLGVPAWVDVDVAVLMLGLTTLAALAPARRLTRVP